MHRYFKSTLLILTKNTTLYLSQLFTCIFPNLTLFPQGSQFSLSYKIGQFAIRLKCYIFVASVQNQSSPDWLNLLVCHVATKPPLSSMIVADGTAEILVEVSVVTKVIFTWGRSSVRFTGTASRRAVDVGQVLVLNLPELCCCITCCMSTDAHILNREALTVTPECHDVKVAELASEVISVINLLLHLVKDAGCTPVC